MIFKNPFENYKDCQVEVTCQGIIYRGRLVGGTEEEVFLQTSTEWVSLPMDGISLVKPVES